MSAVAVNVTVTAPTGSGYITAYADGGTRPTASSLNFRTGQTVPNLVIAPVGADGKIALVNGSGGTVQLVADVSGYYLAGTPTDPGTFGSVTPYRALDTRGDFIGGPPLKPRSADAVTVAGLGGVPASGVSAVAVNVTVANPTAPGYITALPKAFAPAVSSNLNFTAGQTVANLVIAPVGSDGRIVLFNGSGATVQLVADVAGYYLTGAPSDAGAFGEITPTRVLDTRVGLGAPAAAVGGARSITVKVTGTDGVPIYGVSAVAVNVTVTDPTAGGYLTVYAGGARRPAASNLNFTRGQTVANLVLAPVAPDGTIQLYNSSPGTVHLVADLAGYYRTDPRLTGPVTAVAAGAFYTCALLSDATVDCWGDNSDGVLGDRYAEDVRLTPGPVPGLTGVIELAGGDDSVCALLTTGYVDCWGHNQNGELGDGTTTDRPTPTPVPGLTAVKALTAGYLHTCALLAAGTVECWGYNAAGELGDGTETDHHTPTAVPGLSGVKSLTVNGQHSCAVLTDSTVDCWGDNGRGALGDGTTNTVRDSPTPVPGLRDVTALGLGDDHTCALLSGGTVECWGENSDGELGDTTTTDHPTPQPVPGLTGVTALTGGSHHTCALLSNGTVDCWGLNLEGDLGDGTTTDRDTPGPVPGLDDAVALTSGFAHNCAVLDTGALDCWGTNHYGQLGNGNTTYSDTPAPVTPTW